MLHLRFGENPTKNAPEEDRSPEKGAHGPSVYTDLKGPITLAAKEDHLFVAKFTGDGTRMKESVLLTSKAEDVTS